jgi:hypothetical protein
MKIYKFFRLPRVEQRLFLRALYLLVYFRLGLKNRTLQFLLHDLEDKWSRSVRLIEPIVPLQNISRSVAIASRYVPFSTCLSRALAGKVLCCENGYATKIHIGVSKNDIAGFEAHAWLTFQGARIVGDISSIDRFKEMPLLPKENN